MLLEVNGKAIWVDKTARNVHRLDYILAHFPNARVIYVVRDPRDLVASLKTHRKRKIVDGRLVPTGYCMPVDLCIERCELALRDGLKHRGTPYYHEVRYEDLVTDTEAAVRGMCDFLEVAFEPQMLAFHLQTTSTRDYMHFPQNIEATRPISASAIGRSRTGLTADEFAMVEDRLCVYLDALGYPVPPGITTSVRVPRGAAREPELTVVSAEQVYGAIGGDPLRVKQWTREALRVHHEGRYLQPQKT